MFSNEIYGFSQIKKGQGMKPKECSEIKAEINEEWNEPHSLRNIDDLMLRMKIEEYKQQCGMGLKRSGEGLMRAGGGLKRSGGGLKRSGGGLKRSGGGLKRSGDGMCGEGLIQTGGAYETIGINQIGGECDICPMEQTERPKIGQELRDLMIKQFCK